MKESGKNQRDSNPATSLSSSERVYRCLGLALQATTGEVNEWRVVRCVAQNVSSQDREGERTVGRRRQVGEEQEKGIYLGAVIAGGATGWVEGGSRRGPRHYWQGW
jgi:hypothetical protein